jgi:hypothetical protein
LAHLYDPGCKALLDRISDQAHISPPLGEVEHWAIWSVVE